jgi:hypothetical protein
LLDGAITAAGPAHEFTIALRANVHVMLCAVFTERALIGADHRRGTRWQTSVATLAVSLHLKSHADLHNSLYFTYLREIRIISLSYQNYIHRTAASYTPVCYNQNDHGRKPKQE